MVDILRFALIAAMLVQVPQPPRPTVPQTFGDRAAAESAFRGYRDAWVANNADRVMATLTPDAVIYPSTLPPIAGAAAIRQFWFPSSGPATRVIDLEQSIDNMHVDGDTAVISGMGSLTFVVTSDTGASTPTTRKHWHVNVLRRQRDGRWMIWRRMWGDLR
jgi:uncharacterized protein (TIGR02246 family)